MSWDKNKRIPKEDLYGAISPATVKLAEEFGTYLAKDENNGKTSKLTTSQLRKFFGEVKRQQMSKFDLTEFCMLKAKLAYAVGRARQKSNVEYKIKDFYDVLADAIDKVCESPNKEKARQNFIQFFEAIVAYHKAAEK